MPRTPIDYSQICIYKLVHKEDYDNENIYIGSTTNFRKRKNTHKSSCNCETNKEHNQEKYTYISTIRHPLRLLIGRKIIATC